MVDHELNSFVDQFDDLTIQEIKDHEYYTIQYLKEGFGPEKWEEELYDLSPLNNLNKLPVIKLCKKLIYGCQGK